MKSSLKKMWARVAPRWVGRRLRHHPWFILRAGARKDVHASKTVTTARRAWRVWSVSVGETLAVVACSRRCRGSGKRAWRGVGLVATCPSVYSGQRASKRQLLGLAKGSDSTWTPQRQEASPRSRAVAHRGHSLLRAHAQEEGRAGVLERCVERAIVCSLQCRRQKSAMHPRDAPVRAQRQGAILSAGSRR
jgi:hypothetical protein